MIEALAHRFAYIELEVLSLRKENRRLAEENARCTVIAQNHCPLWTAEIVDLVQQEFPGVAPMYFNDHIRRMKAELIQLRGEINTNQSNT